MENIIDTHFHIWDLELRSTFEKTDGSFDWPDQSLPLIHRNILADEAAQELRSSKVDGAIFVQCLKVVLKKSNGWKSYPKVFQSSKE